MKFQYEDVKVVFCDEISMVGSMKLAKINFRFQDIADGPKKQDFMGGISFVASGKAYKDQVKIFIDVFQVIYGNFHQSMIIWLLKIII